eukprot:131880-Pyramimonas_sp.AAC.1
MTTDTASCESLRAPRPMHDAPAATGRERATAPQTATLSPTRSAGEAKTSRNASSSVRRCKTSRVCWEF